MTGRPTPNLSAAIDALRDYLDTTGFARIYKFVAGVNQYAVTPALVCRRTAAEVERFFDAGLFGGDGLALLQCLMLGRPAARGALTAGEAKLVDALVAVDLLREADCGQTVVAADRQLISAFGVNLLVDRRIHFGGGVHEVYIGPDSFWMLYYIDVAALRGTRALDLCTGSGIAALYLALFADTVIATDIGDVPLSVAAINRRLNGLEDRIEIRRQDLRDTLAAGERYDVLTCNPAFVAFPPGLDGTLYAQGTEADGLGYLRTIIEHLPDVLVPGGCAYLVADLVGDARRPHFIAEIEAYAARHRLAIDVFIDTMLPASAQVEPLSGFLARLHGRPRDEIAARFAAFQRHTLRADAYYMSTLRLRTEAASPGVRVMRRDLAIQARPREDAWPALLRA